MSTTFRHRGFTLIELLIVIAIIGVLSALLVPVISKIRGDAEQARNTSNLRQIGSAVLQFAGENNGRTPTAGGVIRRNETDPTTGQPAWTEQIAPIVQSDWRVFRKPRAQASEEVSYYLGGRAAYVAANAAGEAVAFQPVILSRVASPSRYILVGEIGAVTFPPEDADPDNFSREPSFNGSTTPSSTKRQLFFADGHAAAFRNYDPTLMTTTYEGTETSFNP